MNLLAKRVLIIGFGWLMMGITLLESRPYSPSASHTDSIYLPSRTQTDDLPDEKQAIMAATNQQRTRKRLPALKPDARLMQAAQEYAELMAARDQLSHTLNGLKLTDKANRVNYPYQQLAENIALNTQLDGRFVVVEQWMESKGHRKNILTKGITEIGVGIAGPSKQKRYYYCQLFGAQR